MEIIFEWLRAHTDILGFTVATLIFFITILLVIRKLIGFWITLLFLLFSIVAGLVLSNQGFMREWLMKDKVERVQAPMTHIPESAPESAQEDAAE